jgi:hypothetical protein
MPIPTDADRREANVDMLARGISGQLRTLRFAGKKDQQRLRLAAVAGQFRRGRHAGRRRNQLMAYIRDPQFRRGNPEADALEERKRRHAGLVSFIGSHGGWATSVPGAREVRIECLPGSALPATLTRTGYELRRGEDGTRILPVAVSQVFVQNADGALAVAEGSTRMVTHSAGIAPVERWSFTLP